MNPVNLNNSLPSSNYKEKVFFYCSPAGPPEKSAYQHELVCLAEGLNSLGVEFYSNINYWRTSPEQETYLFRYSPEIQPDDCSIVVLHGTWFGEGNSFPENLFNPQRKYKTVYIDSEDGTRTRSWDAGFRKFDFIFRTHYNIKWRYPSNIHPWVFGLSNRVLRETEHFNSFQERKKRLLVNFRVYHSLRETVRKKVFPYLQEVLPLDEAGESFNNPPSEGYHYLQWVQTGRRHYPTYYTRLKQFAACACFGGELVSPWPPDAAGLVTPVGRALTKIMKTLELPPRLVSQWDSWRFWESLAAGCVTFHVDFEKYGCFPPVMPENWRHYVGIDLDNIQRDVERIADAPEILERISTEGRQWALHHYSPVPTAIRFLETIR
jgi:hypothetical protein